MICSRVLTLTIILSFTSMASVSQGEVIDFSGIDGTDVSDGDGQTFPWSFGTVIGDVTLSADWDNLPDQSGPIRTATAAGASLASPFLGTLTLEFSQPVELTLSATFSSLLNDGLSGGRFERVTLSTTGAATFVAEAGTTALYSGEGTQQITADDEFSTNPTTSIWGFAGSGLADSYTFEYTSTTVGFSETFNVNITAVPEPSLFPLLASGLIGMSLVLRRHPCRQASFGRGVTR